MFHGYLVSTACHNLQFYYNVHHQDAATGLVTEPLEGAKKDVSHSFDIVMRIPAHDRTQGALGFVKGLVRGGINAGVRPAAGE